MTFDRSGFEFDKTRLLAEQAQDQVLFDMGRDFTVRADLHNYAYHWTWCGLPIIQMPQDVVALQQIIWQSRPSVIIETGVAWGGGVALYASMMDIYGGRLVIGVDLNLAASVRDAVGDLPFKTRIELLEGSSVDDSILRQIQGMLVPSDRVMVVLDSDHTHAHVLSELHAYSGLVTTGQYLIVSDTIVERIPPQTHRPRAWGPGDNPGTAVEAFLEDTGDFVVDRDLDAQLVMSFNPGGYLRRVGQLDAVPRT